jgi:hypothetical protein
MGQAFFYGIIRQPIPSLLPNDFLCDLLFLGKLGGKKLLTAEHAENAAKSAEKSNARPYTAFI